MLQRWNGGCRNALQLDREIKAQGYAYSSHTGERFIRTLREAPGRPRSFRRVAANPPEKRVKAVREPQPYTAYRTAVLMVTEPRTRSRAQQTYVERLRVGDAQVAHSGKQVAEFMCMVRERPAPDLERWLEEIATGGVAALQTLAGGLHAELGAVRAGLSLAWSNGQTEGEVNRL